MDFLTVVTLTTLSWQLSFSTCNTLFKVPGHALLDHVMQSVTGTSSADSCLDKCGANSSCHSINWYSNTGLCQLNQGTHLSYPEGLVASDSSASYKLYSLHPMVTCSNRFCSDPDICLMNNDGIKYRCESCSGALGMQDGRISNSQITASSFYAANHEAWRGRLHHTGGAGGWVSKNPAAGEWLQVDLTHAHIISKVATQGRGNYDQWTTKYYLKYSQDGVNWESYKYGSNVKEFKGNTDKMTVITYKLPVSIKARFIRIVVTSWYGDHPPIRMELYGCLLSLNARPF